MRRDVLNIFKGSAKWFFLEMCISQGPGRKEVIHSEGVNGRLTEGPFTVCKWG